VFRHERISHPVKLNELGRINKKTKAKKFILWIFYIANQL
jgi:hypothetical protein